MGVGPFSSESTATQKINSASDNAQIGVNSTIFQGNAKGASGKGAKYAESGALIDSQTGGLNLSKLKKFKGTINFVDNGSANSSGKNSAVDQANSTDISGGATSPFNQPGIPPIPSNTTPPTDPKTTAKDGGFLDKIKSFFTEAGSDGTTSLNKSAIAIAFGLFVGLAFVIKIARGK